MSVAGAAVAWCEEKSLCCCAKAMERGAVESKRMGVGCCAAGVG